MKVIFIKDLRGQGKIHEIKDVSDGYATNFLIKNGYAIKYSKTSSNILEEEIKQININEQKNIANANKLKLDLENLVLEFQIKHGKDGKIFGTISTKQISEELNKRGYSIDKRNIELLSPINFLGEYKFNIIIYKNIIATLKLKLL